MIGIAIAAEKEWESVISYYNVSSTKLKTYPFGVYFEEKIVNTTVLFYWCGTRKVNSASATQYMISVLGIDQVIVLGTCAGINDKYKNLDIVIPNRAVQYDCTVKEIEPLIKERFSVDLKTKDYCFNYHQGTIGTADKPVVMWNDYLELKRNNIDIADTESAAIGYVCDRNQIDCTIVKGISDFPIEDDPLNEIQIQVFLNNIPLIMYNLLSKLNEIIN